MIPGTESTQHPRARAREICARYEAPASFRPLLADDPSLLAFLDRLVLDDTQYPEAVEFLAHSLPLRTAVWWGAVCVELCQGLALAPMEDTALAATVAWVREPAERKAQEAGDVALHGGPALPGTPTGLLACAASAAGGKPPVGPLAEALSTANVSLAIQLTLHRLGAVEAVLAGYQQCIALGIGMVHGKHLGPLATAAVIKVRSDLRRAGRD